MRNQLFAMSMATHCLPEFAKLILAVTAKHTDEAVQHRLITAIAHSSNMANTCHTQPAREVIYGITERLFNDASPQCFSVQDAAHWEVVRETAFASLMAHNCPGGAEEIHGLLQPFGTCDLPRTVEDRKRLSARLQAAYVAMRDISWRR